MKIGLLLGSFDPPHIGHVYAAMYALNNGMDEVWVVPAWQNPWKTNQSEWVHRYEMCKIMFKDCPRVTVQLLDSCWKTHYTYEGLEKLGSLRLGDGESLKNIEYYIIGGTDITKAIPNWKKGDWILQNFGVIEVPRIGVTNDKTEVGIECSSTAIRQMLNNKLNPLPFINKEVIHYIEDNKLYKK